MEPTAAILPCGTRLHLQHGPIDLIIGADGDRSQAFAVAREVFRIVLSDLVGELDVLREPVGALVHGHTAMRMRAAVFPLSDQFITPMAAVAGAVADTVLTAMVTGADLHRAYVNNGGDIALHLTPDATFSVQIAAQDGRDTGRITVTGRDGIGGIATSGRGGRSLSMGIADSVTVLANNAASANAAATLIANHVDLPGHPAILRAPACDLRDDTDLGDRLVVTECGVLSTPERETALSAGTRYAETLCAAGHIHAACLMLQGAAMQTRRAAAELFQKDEHLCLT
jgi:ApbE superfamily uncharacterized protein (UPF0280 family)